MSLRKAAEMALDTLEYAVRCAAMFECERAAEILRAALAEPDEYTVECNGKKSSVLTAMMNSRTKREAALAEADEPDLSKCPNCGGPADNGHDRCVPPNPYWCVKCETHPLDAITGAAEMRLSEIGKALEQAVARRNGQTILADVVHALACLDRAEAEVERLRADAARYRWLRSSKCSLDESRLMVDIVRSYEDGDMDAAIDAARGES